LRRAADERRIVVTMHRHLLLIAGTVLFGCGGIYGPRYDSAARPYEASYDLVADGASFGSARVVASSAEQAVIGGEERVVLPVTVLVNNVAEEDVLLGTRQVELAYVETQDGSRVTGESIEVVRRAADVGDDGTARIDAAFALPPGYAVKDVASFGVKWGVQRSGESFTETTAFAIPPSSTTPIVVMTGAQAGYEEFYNGLMNKPYRAEPVRAPISGGERIPAQAAGKK